MNQQMYDSICEQYAEEILREHEVRTKETYEEQKEYFWGTTYEKICDSALNTFGCDKTYQVLLFTRHRDAYMEQDSDMDVRGDFDDLALTVASYAMTADIQFHIKILAQVRFNLNSQ